MPSDSTPRMAALRSLRPFSSTAPVRLTATVSPAWKLSAPQTICLTPPLRSPTSTVQSESLSALGCFWRVTTLPTTKRARLSASRGAPTHSMFSTSLPDMLSSSARSSSCRRTDVLTQPADGTLIALLLDGRLVALRPAPLRRPVCARAAHQNCSRKRTSLSKNRRRSGMLCLSMAMRSTPMPKAKPETCSGS